MFETYYNNLPHVIEMKADVARLEELLAKLEALKVEIREVTK